MRPIYESQFDRNNEQDVADILSKTWEAEIKKLPMSYNVDWIMLRNGEIKAFAELKVRKNYKDKYPTLLLSFNKWRHGIDMGKTVGVPFIIIVKWNEGIFWHTAGKSSVTFGVGGRRDRGDPYDIEPVVYIPTSAFTKVN